MSLHDLQSRVHVGKDKRNDFGGYNYRTAEGILAAAKAALPEGAYITVTDDMREVAGQIFVQATARVWFPDDGEYTATAFAMHPLTKKGMDPSQITGSASSYARKYALAGLLALDDGSADPDAAKAPYEPEERAPEPQPKPPAPEETRDRIKAAIEARRTLPDLRKLWDHEATAKALDGLPEPMRLEVTSAYSKRFDMLGGNNEQAPGEAA